MAWVRDPSSAARSSSPAPRRKQLMHATEDSLHSFEPVSVDGKELSNETWLSMSREDSRQL